MSKQQQHVLEYSKPSVEGNVIRGVKIIGLQSANGYAYPADVLGRAVALYESAPVFLMHGDPREKKRGHRLLRDHFGSLENVKGNGDGLFGDLNVRTAHPLARQILEEALTASFGLSHNAIIELNEDGSLVTSIVQVNSVDLVDAPATTINLFEENPVAKDDFLAAINKRLDDFEAKYIKATESKVVHENHPLPLKRLVALENAGDGEGGGAPVGNTHEDFMGALRGFPLT